MKRFKKRPLMTSSVTHALARQARHLLACSLIFSVVAMVSTEGTQPLFAQASAATTQAATPMALHIEIIEGDDALNNIRERTAREPIVQVEDENHKPVSGALVLFLVNGGDSGASGSFGSLASFSTVTDSTGRAVAHGFTPNQTAGQYTISVTATVGSVVANAVIHESNVTAATTTPTNQPSAKAPLPHHGVAKWVLVTGGVAVAVGIVLAVTLTNGGSHSATITPGTGTVAAPTAKR